MDLKEKVAQIAQYLEGWEIYLRDPLHQNRWVQLRKTGEGEQPSIHCNTDGWNTDIKEGNRLEFGGNWPERTTEATFYPYNEKHKIGCSAKRTPASIAKDIQRRLLPGYLPKWAEMLENKQAHLKAVAQRNIDLASIANILEKEICSRGDQVYVSGGFFKARNGGSFEIRLTGISVEVARQIAVILTRP